MNNTDKTTSKGERESNAILTQQFSQSILPVRCYWPMNADEFAKQPGEVQHLVEVRVRNVPQSRHYSIACIDNPMSLNHSALKLLPTMVQMSHGINSATCVLPVLPLSVNWECCDRFSIQLSFTVKLIWTHRFTRKHINMCERIKWQKRKFDWKLNCIELRNTDECSKFEL